MSKFVQKTLHSLNAVLNNSGMFYTEKDKLMGTRNLEISSFVGKIKNVTSKHEEEAVVSQYFSKIKSRLSEPDVSSAEVEDMVKICIVCEAMGYEAGFIYVHALKLAQKGNLQQKHTGYLSAAISLHPHHELVILLINTLQRDLASSNHLEVILALTSVCHLISSETVHNVMHLVEDKLQHPVPSVRKSAVLTFAHCLQLMGGGSSIKVALSKLERSLSDPELEVVSVVIPTISRIIKEMPGDFTYLVDSLLQLLEQILMRRIPHSLNYSDIPAPWLQIEILKLLKHICKSSESSAKVSPVLKKILVQTGLYHTIAQAIVFQVIETIASIEADAELLEVAMSSVSLLLKSRDVNMKFMGLDALVLLMKKMEPNISPSQQDIIMDCLKLSDETLQLKTLELMYHLANPSNVQAICKKMIEFLDHTKENQKKDLAMKILKLAEKYHNRHHWYISVVNAVLIKVDNLIESSDICNIINVIAKDNELKKISKEEILKLMQETKCVPSSLLKIHSSVLSVPSDFVPALSLLSSAPEDALSWLLVSLMESILKHRTIPPECVSALAELETKNFSSMNIFVKQILQIVQNIDDIKQFEPYAKIDPSLTFLDNFVLKSFKQLEDSYEPPSLRTAISIDSFIPSSSDVPGNSFSLVAAAGEIISEKWESSASLQSPAYSIFSSPSMSFQSLSGDVESFSPLKNKVIWTKEGRSKAIVDNISLQREDDAEVEENELLELFAGIS